MCALIYMLFTIINSYFILSCDSFVSNKVISLSKYCNSNCKYKYNQNNVNQQIVTGNSIIKSSNNYINSKDNQLDIIESLRSPELSLVLGVIGIFIILINRFSIPLDKVTDIQSRADIIAVIASSSLLLNGLSEFEVKTRERDQIALVGYSLKSPWINSNINNQTKAVITWGINAIIKCTPSTSVHIFQGNEVLSRGGVIGFEDSKCENTINTSMTILQDTLNSNKELYLPDLQILPGKIEFTYLPINCQSVFLLPFDKRILVIGTNKAKSLTSKDLLRIRSVANIINQSL